VLTSTDADTVSAHDSFGWTADGTNHQYTLELRDAKCTPAELLSPQCQGDDNCRCRNYAQDWFKMNVATGQLSVKLDAKLNYETQNTISIFVVVTDQNKGGGPAYHPGSKPESAEGEFVVNVLNLNEAPIIDRVGPFYFKKGSAIGTVIGTLTATDVDEVNQNSGTMLSGGCCYTFVYRKVSVSVIGTDKANSGTNDLEVDKDSGIITLQRDNVLTSSNTPTT